MDETVAERIYEAAVNAEAWPAAIDQLSALSGSDSGGLMMFDAARPFCYVATGRTVEVADVYVTQGGWMTSGRMPYFMANPFTRFGCSADFFPPDVEHDDAYRKAADLGLDHQAGTFIRMPTGELAVFVLNRRREDGAYNDAEMKRLDGVHAHLARAALIAGRLGLERARTSVSLMDQLRIPAAVLSSAGQVRASNALLDRCAPAVQAAAFGRLRLRHGPADQLLQEALRASGSAHDPGVRSIPLPGDDQNPPLVIHLLPIRRSAHDIFAGADVLIAVTSVNASLLVPEPSVLMGLFDLTPSEVKIAQALSKGQTLHEASGAAGVRIKSARTYLDRIFAKTGTNQQSQLVALLKTTHSF